jgi:Protein of unknown function, DUF417
MQQTSERVTPLIDVFLRPHGWQGHVAQEHGLPAAARIHDRLCCGKGCPHELQTPEIEGSAGQQRNETMNSLINILTKSGLLTKDLDYHLIRASMVIIFLFFGYQKWFEYEAQVLIPYISNGPPISWMYPVFGVRGDSTEGLTFHHT